MMKPTLQNCHMPAASSLRPSFARSQKSGKVLTPSLSADRRSIFKVPQNVSRLRKSTRSPIRGVSKQAPGRVNSRVSLRMSTAVPTMSRLPQFDNSFLRPYDMVKARKHIVDRMIRLAELSSENTVDNNSKVSKDPPITKPYAIHTPMQGPLTKVYLKLSESVKKSARRVKAPETPTSPFEETKSIQREDSVPAKAQEKSLNKTQTTTCDVGTQSLMAAEDEDNVIRNCNKSALGGGDTRINRNEMKEVAVQSYPDKCTAGIKEETLHGDHIEGAENCVLNNILKHCEMYSVKMSGINEALGSLDDAFQRIMVGEVGSQMYVRFCEYQKKKFELYRKMKELEEELEDAVRSEADVQARFREYLKKRGGVFQERSNLMDNFKNTMKSILWKYEEDVKKSAMGKSLEDAMRALVPDVERRTVEDVEDVENVKPVLRRSKRLMATPKTSAKKETEGRRISRKATPRRQPGNDELVIKKRTGTTEKKLIQRSIYEDLQKSFNLCSPECSF